MKKTLKLFIWRILPMMLTGIILQIIGCRNSYLIDGRLDQADMLMEEHPDSALSIINSIEISNLANGRQKARYALLKSMALDKNYVDTTTFDVLQPAIDYYLENGNPDEKLRTYYYQGRIYQNRNEPDSALQSFMRGLDIAENCRDSLTIARILVVQGMVYQSFYDSRGYTDSYLEAAKIYHDKQKQNYEFDCLTRALSGICILKDQQQADSVMEILDKFDSLNSEQKQLLRSIRLTYVHVFGSRQDLQKLLKSNNDSLKYNINGLLNIARGYSRLGENGKAMQMIDRIDETHTDYDTLKYLSIKYPILEALERHEEALMVFKDFVYRLEIINSSKLAQKSQSMEEKHQMELKAEREAERHRWMIWIATAVMVFLLMGVVIVLLLMYRFKAKKELAEQKAIAAQLENDKLNAENRVLNLVNSNLQLEHDKKTLEAENLAHRVEELEGESQTLREVLEKKEEMPQEVRNAIQNRIEMLNAYLASQISEHKELEKAYDKWVEELTADKERFMDTNRLAFTASHPDFIRHFEEHGLTTAEINYVCLYAIGLRGKDVGSYMKMRSHVNVSSAIRKKLGLDKHDTNISLYVRRLLQNL